MSNQGALHSTLDRSINLISPHRKGGSFESRFVQRETETAIVYLSSMTGCDLSCRFCWLTQLNQTEMNQATVADYITQAQGILSVASEKYDLHEVKTVHFNFMARGDVLSNFHFITQYKLIFQKLSDVARMFLPRGLVVKFKISTIFPESLIASLGLDSRPERLRTHLVDPILETQLTNDWEVEFYYSLYSLRPEFRKRWIPKGLDVDVVGEIFRGRHQGFRLHHALISGKNDTEEDIALIHDWLERHDLQAIYNLVRYNPYGLKCGEESDEVTRATYLTQLGLSHRIALTQVIARVGADVKASCGMFVED